MANRVSDFGADFGADFGSVLGKGELCIKIGNGGGLEDGDVNDVRNRRMRRYVHASNICWPRVNGRRVGGMLGETQPLLEGLLQNIQQYRWDRVSHNEVKRTNLRTLDEVVYGSTAISDPDKPGRMIHCHVAAFLERAVSDGKYPLFGATGAERFYFGDGKEQAGHTELDAIWNMIETQTPEREIDYPDWPWTDEEKRRFLIIDVDDFDDATAGDLTGPLLENPGDPQGSAVLKPRKNGIAWRNLRDVVEADVNDPATVVDIRGRKHVRSEIITLKT